MKRLLVTFEIDKKEVKVCINAVKKAMDFDPEYERLSDVYRNAEIKAVEKLYGKGKYFIEQHGNEGFGQIFESSKYGGSDSVTGVIYVTSNFNEVA